MSRLAPGLQHLETAGLIRGTFTPLCNGHAKAETA